MVHLLEHLEQDQQAKTRSLAPCRTPRPLEFVGQWRVAGLQIPGRKDLGKSRVGGALDGSHASHPDRRGPLRLAQENRVAIASYWNMAANSHNQKAYDRNLRV